MLIVQEVTEGEGDGSPQAPVGDDELVLRRQLHNSELVDEPGEDQDAWEWGRASCEQMVKDALQPQREPPGSPACSPAQCHLLGAMGAGGCCPARSSQHSSLASTPRLA